MKRSGLVPYLLVSPAMLLLVVFGVFPILVAAVVSLTDMNISGLANWANVKFIGLDNYHKLSSDPDFGKALFNTAVFVILGVPSVVILSLLVALLLHRSGGRFARALRSRIGQLKSGVMASTSRPTETQSRQIPEVRAAMDKAIQDANRLIGEFASLQKEMAESGVYPASVKPIQADGSRPD